MSMKPGATTLPAASISSSASGTWPTTATRPSLSPTSATTGSAPVPSTTRPLRITRSSVIPRLPERGRGRLVHLTPDDHDAVARAGGVDGHLAVQDVRENRGGVALERRAEPAASRRDMREAVTLDEGVRLHRHRRELAGFAAGDHDVARCCSRLAPVEPVGTMVAAVGADRQRRAVGEHAVRANVCQPTPLSPRASGVGHDAVALDGDRKVGFE